MFDFFDLSLLLFLLVFLFLFCAICSFLLCLFLCGGILLQGRFFNLRIFSALFNEANYVLNLHSLELILLLFSRLFRGFLRLVTRDHQIHGFWGIKKDWCPAKFTELVHTSMALVLICLVFWAFFIFFRLSTTWVSTEFTQAKFDYVDFIAPAFNMIWAPLRAAGWSIQFNSNISSIKIKLIPYVKMIFLFDLEELIIVKVTFVHLLEVLDVHPRALLIVFQGLYLIQKLLDSFFLSIFNARSLNQLIFCKKEK